MIYLWHKAGRQKLPESCSLISKQFHFLHTDVDSKTNLLFVRGRNSYPPLALLCLFLTCINSGWASTHQTWDYTTFWFGFACTCCICSPMLNKEDKISSTSSYSSCIYITQKGQTHLLAPTMLHRSPLCYHQLQKQRMRKNPLSGQAQHPLHWLHAP